MGTNLASRDFLSTLQTFSTIYKKRPHIKCGLYIYYSADSSASGAS